MATHRARRPTPSQTEIHARAGWMFMLALVAAQLAVIVWAILAG